jgi:hypothetical protein
MKLRDKFMTVCTGCDGDGDGKVENEVFQMGEVKYYYTQCDCENGKEFDWKKVDSEIKDTKESIESLNVNLIALNSLMRENLDVNNDHVLNAFRQLVKYENKVTELETYLAELEEL